MKRFLSMAILLCACGQPAHIRGEGSVKVEPDGSLEVHGLIGVDAGPLKLLMTEEQVSVCIDLPVTFCWTHPL